MGWLTAALGILKSLLGIGEKVTEERHDQAERDAGAATQRDRDRGADAQIITSAQKAAKNVDSTAPDPNDLDAPRGL